MNTLMHRTAIFLPRPLVKGLSWISREFSINNPLLRLREDFSKQAEDRRAYRLRRWREDETYRQSNMEWTYGWFGRKMEDPSYREARKESLRVAHQQRYQDKQISGRIRFRRWLTGSSKKLRESLVWKTHAPILYEEKVMHTCVDCGYPSRGGLKLWWQQISDPSQFKCQAMPVGYENKFSSTTKSRPNPSGAELPADVESKVHITNGHSEDEKKST